MRGFQIRRIDAHAITPDGFRNPAGGKARNPRTAIVQVSQNSYVDSPRGIYG